MFVKRFLEQRGKKWFTIALSAKKNIME
jgi:hypothetical protein